MSGPIFLCARRQAWDVEQKSANIKKGTLSDSATTVKIRIKSGKLLNQLFPLHLRFESKDENDGTDGTPEVFMWDSARGGLQ
jgi:hypothetical protein